MITSDTAMTVRKGDSIFRYPQHIQKLVQIGRFLIFTSGSVDISFSVMRKFERSGVKTVESFQAILREVHQKLSDVEDQKDGVGALIAEWVEGETRVHTLQPIDGYDIHSYQCLDDGSSLHTAGIMAKEAEDFLDPLLRQGEAAASELTRAAFEEFSGADIGGLMITARLSKDGIYFTRPQSIKEKVRIPYYGEAGMMESNFVQLPISGGIMTGALIKSKNSFPQVVMNPEGNLFGAYTAAGKGVEIRSYGSGGFPDFQFVDGTEYALMRLAGNSPGLYMNGSGSLTMEFTNIVLRGYNSIQVIDWAQLKNEQTGVSLATELQEKANLSEAGFNMSFDPTTRNLKLYSKTGVLLAQVNIPN